MTGPQRRRAKRLRLHAADPRCTWCGVVTVNRSHEEIDGQTVLGDTATLDHVYSKHDSRRKLLNVNRGTTATVLEATLVLHVLACKKCNNRRSFIDVMAFSKWRRHGRLGFYQMPDELFVTHEGTVINEGIRITEHGYVEL